jgi:glycosyltransferase involved in cell wall biosynthesis
MITDNLFLSICIPTYNRINKTLLLVTSILEYDDVDIEVVVLDNCSSDNTETVLGNIKDNRFRYIRNNQAVGGMQNIITSLTYGRGEYVMLCLDKDRILGDKIKEFINHLKKIDVVAGHCLLNTDNYSEDIIYNKGLESVLILLNILQDCLLKTIY